MTFSSAVNPSITSKSPLFNALSFSSDNAASLFLMILTSCGSSELTEHLEPHKSMMSNAESGNFLSVMYLSASLTAFSIASSEYFTL